MPLNLKNEVGISLCLAGRDLELQVTVLWHAEAEDALQRMLMKLLFPMVMVDW